MKSEFVTAITQLAAEKGVPREMVMEAIQQALVSAYKQHEEDSRLITAEIDNDSGEPHVYHWLTVVEDIEDDQDDSNLIILEQARTLKGPDGQPLFPNIGATGGTVQGYQVIVSGNVDPTGDVAANGDNIIFLKPDEIFLADDGSVSIDISREASVQMDGAPDNPALATTITISAFQHNLALIRAERYCNWLKRRAEAVQFISGAKYA